MDISGLLYSSQLLTLLQEESLFDQNPQLVWGLQSCGLSRGQDCLSLFTFGTRRPLPPLPGSLAGAA